jgi:hypothetical protein
MTGVMAAILICVVVAAVVIGWATMIRSSRNKGQPRNMSDDSSSGPAEPPR